MSVKTAVSIIIALMVGFAAAFILPYVRQEKLWRVSPITSMNELVECAESDGKAFMAAELSDDGSSFESDWVGGCIREAK